MRGLLPWPVAYTVSSDDCRAPVPLGFGAPLAEAARTLAGLGFDGLEVQVRDVTADDADLLTHAVAGTGLAVLAIGTGPVASQDGLTLADPSPEVRHHALRRLFGAARLAGALGVPLTLGQTRGVFLPGLEDKQRDWVERAVRRLAAEATAHGCRLLLEPQSRRNTSLWHTPEETLAATRRLALRAGLVLDTHHLEHEGLDPIAVVGEHAGSAGCLQLAAAAARGPLEVGDPRLPRLLQALDGSGFTGWLTLEHTQDGGSEQAATRSLAALSDARTPLAQPLAPRAHTTHPSAKTTEEQDPQMSTTYRLGVLEGDGIGPEIVPSSIEVATAAAQAAGASIDWVALPLGASAITTHGAPVPDETKRALETLDGWVLGPHDSVSYPEPHKSALNPSGTLRKHFQLFANIRPAKSFPGAEAVCDSADLVIVRENTEGFYADRNTHAGTGEFMPTPDTAISMGIVTRHATERVARVAFDLARSRRKKLTIVHKANVLKLTTGLFRTVCQEVAQDYPDVAVDDFHIDAMTVHLVRRAQDFDVIVTENMFGDILSDLAGEISGSLGTAPSINSSADTAMAQASHGSAPDIAGHNTANPVAMILSTAMLFEWLAARHDDPALATTAKIMEKGVADTIATGTSTRDLGGSASTTEFTAAVTKAITSGIGQN
ncbi:isocitrate/isopropylmalate family dehydrogenase [Streptomonospora nanhaiensis]|uniref:Isocitrate/isopropylmalate family dehydrogenase n=1 Tax=Streptomonospora nanhaiensis TaxID=1323731 RepID=A0ABY6YU63_9ACTN|nr:isocitrate/isopropylmalate family dehydrogenase [Streptomonospora nanhaiensis]WAE75805.1 isocitrate/isopropylmalate family dehydrogenase [Streptomonospora nanhaiensis]